jgi:D-3-phosphoglycerate dehydrogenase / 2-oxoglutarate reductase
MTWKIIISDGLGAAGLQLLQAQAAVDDSADLTGLEAADALIVRSRTKVDVDLLNRAVRLKVVGRAGVGVDNIDLTAAAGRGVIVVNAPMAATIAVAEHALALMLALARRLPLADAEMRRGRWAKAELTGTELYGKTLGVVGAGRIGSALAERARGLGMITLATDAYLADEALLALELQPCNLDELLARADVVSLHVPLTDQTRNLIDKHGLAIAKPGMALISTSRGGVVNEDALLHALQSGRVSGAALDVFDTEPPGLNPLIQHPNVISTPHIAAQTVEAQDRASEDIATEVLAALRGDPLRWRVV